MSIGEAINAYRKEHHLSQQELANKLPLDRSYISRIESGERELPEAYDRQIASLSWKLALTIADERTGGYISNILDDVPDLDLHPAALKDILLKELSEAGRALEGLVMAKHIDPEKRRESAKRVWHEIRDVSEKALIMLGVLEEEFNLDRKHLIQEHEMEVKQGDR